MKFKNKIIAVFLSVLMMLTQFGIFPTVATESGRISDPSDNTGIEVAAETETFTMESEESAGGLGFTSQNGQEDESSRAINYVKVTTNGNIPDGVYALRNVANQGFWMDVENDSSSEGSYIQQTQYSTNPFNSFTRPALFKISRLPNTNVYIIRLMTNNALGLRYNTDKNLLSTSIPTNDDDVPMLNAFYITYDTSGYFIKPYNNHQFALSAQDSTSSGEADSPDSRLEFVPVSEADDKARWDLYQYTGNDRSGASVTTPAGWSQGILEGAAGVVGIKTWSTVIGANTPYICVDSSSSNVATSSWNSTALKATVTTTAPGNLKLRCQIKYDDTGTVLYDGVVNYTVYPDLDNKIGYIQNGETGRYIDVEGPSQSTGAIIQQWQFNGKIQSRWTFELQSGGYFRIKSQYSNKYIGVDSTATTVVRQYDTQSDYTLWKIIETSSGNYKFVCKALEASDLVLAVPLSSNSNGTNLTMIAYTDDTNNKDEWVFREPVGTLKINILADLAYCERNTDYNTRTSTNMYEIRAKYFNEFGIVIDYSALTQFSSFGDSCDEMTGGNYLNTCVHGSNAECSNSSGFGNANKELHHKNIYNIIYRVTPPDISVNTVVVFIGHDYCRVDGNGVHCEGGIAGLSWRSSGVSLITNESNALRERKTIMHEIGHWFVAGLDHYGGNGPSTVDKGDGYSEYCIYGEKRNDASVLNNLTICDGCRAAIAAHADKFNH